MPKYEDLQNSNTGRVILDAIKSAREIHEGQLSLDYGFIPHTALADELPIQFKLWDNLAASLPHMLATLTVRDNLKDIPILDATNSDILPDRYLSRAALILSALAHAYFYYYKDQNKLMLPDAILIPWQQVCARIGRLKTNRNNYDTFLCNWKLNKNISIQNATIDDLELLVPVFNSQDEKIFCLVNFISELRFAKAFPHIIQLLNALNKQKDDEIIKELSLLANVMTDITNELSNMSPNHLSKHFIDPVVWAKTVARMDVPVFSDVASVTGSLSPFFHVMDCLLERSIFDSKLGQDMLKMRKWLPQTHQKFITALEDDLKSKSLKEYINKSDNIYLKNQYLQLQNTYLGEDGWFYKHKQKVYGFMKSSFRAGRVETSGKQTGTTTIETEPAKSLENNFSIAIAERAEAKVLVCPMAKINNNSSLCKKNKVNELTLDISDTSINFSLGDRCAVYPKNDVSQIYHSFNIINQKNSNLNAHMCIHLTDNWQECLSHIWSNKTANIHLVEFLRYVNLKRLNKKVEQYKGVITIDKIIEFCKPLKSRLYSVTNILPGKITLTVGQCHQKINDETMAGVASNFLINTVAGDPVAIKKVAAPNFHLPVNPSTPILMFAGGSGISPFIGFIEKRCQQENAGPIWLFYSVKKPKYFLYRERLETLAREGKIRLIVNYSNNKVHIDDSIRNNSTQIINTIFPENEKYNNFPNLSGEIYICGAAGFAESAKKALIEVISNLKIKDPRKAHSYVEKAIADNKWHIDAFTSKPPCKIRYYKLSDVSKCDNFDKCHIIINNKVYDITRYLNLHEGGRKSLFINAGADATSDFKSIKHNNNHVIKSLLKQFYFGKLSLPELNESNLVCFNTWRDFLYAVQEMRNTLINNSTFTDKANKPFYIWYDIFSTFLLGSFQYVFNSRRAALYTSSSKILNKFNAIQISSINNIFGLNEELNSMILKKISTAAVNDNKFSHFIAYYDQLIHISIQFLDNVKKSILDVIAEFEMKNNLYDQNILNTSLEMIDLKIKRFMEEIDEYLKLSINELKTNLAETTQEISTVEVTSAADAPDTLDILTKDKESARTRVALTEASNRFRFFNSNQNKLSDSPVVDVISKENNVCLP